MNTVKTWLIAATAALVFLAVGALEDGPDQEQLSADELRAAQMHQQQELAQVKRDIKARAAFMNHLLALDKIKETGK